MVEACRPGERKVLCQERERNGSMEELQQVEDYMAMYPEAPAVEEPSQLPGWGNWADRQREPAWLLSAKAQAQKCAPFMQDALRGEDGCIRSAWMGL